LITQRLLKASLAGSPSPYASEELGGAGATLHGKRGCGEKVERQVGKSAAGAGVCVEESANSSMRL